MNNSFDFLNLWHLNNFFNNLFDWNNLRNFDDPINNFLDNFFNFNNFRYNSEDF